MASTTSQTASAAQAGPAAASSSMVLLAFAGVYILWGSTYFFIRMGVETIPPFIMAGIRHLAIGLVFYPLFRRLTREKPTAAQWRTTAITGLLLLLCGNGGVSWAETRVPSGIAALLVASGTILAAVLLVITAPHRPAVPKDEEVVPVCSES